jgi:hypothetical protein
MKRKASEICTKIEDSVFSPIWRRIRLINERGGNGRYQVSESNEMPDPSTDSALLENEWGMGLTNERGILIFI